MAYGKLGKMNPLEAMFMYVRTLEEEKPDLWDAYTGEPDAGGEEENEKQDEEANEEGADGEEKEEAVVVGGEEGVGEGGMQVVGGGKGQGEKAGGGAVDAAAADGEGAGAADAAPEAGAQASSKQVESSPKSQARPALQARLPHVPREAGQLDALVEEALRLSRLPSREAAHKHLAGLKPDLQSLVRRMIFVVELLANQADLARKVREASALRKALDVPGGVERETGIKVTSLVECGELVIGVIERELADWTAAIAEELAAGPEDMIPDRGVFGFRYLPQLAQLKAAWGEHLSDWQAMRMKVPGGEGSSFSIYNMLFQNISS
eukprot:jgi/Tetstr1/458411/TSEL_044847.t1